MRRERTTSMKISHLSLNPPVPSQSSWSLFTAALVFILLVAAQTGASAQPSLRWARFTDAYGKDDYIEDVAVDPAGNIYVAGWITNHANNRDYYVARYDAQGTRTWYKVYDGGGDDEARSIAVNGSRVYVTGTSRVGGELGADEDIVSFILDSSGTAAMDSAAALRYDFGTLHQNDAAIKVVAGAQDTFFVAGTHRDSLSSADHYTVLEYGSGGLLHEGGYSSGNSDHLVAMAVTNASDVYITGTSFILASGVYEFTTVKYDRALQQQWVRTYSHAGFDEAMALFVDNSGVYVTGRSAATCGDLDVATVRYSAGGSQVWVARSFECASTQVAPGGITSDADYVYVTGYHANGSELYKYEKTTGIMRLRPQSPLQSYWNTILVEDGTGSIYAAGHHLWYDQPSDGWHLAKFNAAGDLLADILYDGSGAGNVNTMAKMVQSNADSSLVMVGSTTIGVQQDIMILKYGVGGTFFTDGVYENDGPASVHSLPDQFALSQNYPNPFNPSTRIQFALREGGIVSLDIYDMLGQKVRTVLSGQAMPAGMHELTVDASGLTSGVYIYRIIADRGKFTASKKMIVAK